jgi:hypothetical protein
LLGLYKQLAITHAVTTRKNHPLLWKRHELRTLVLHKFSWAESILWIDLALNCFVNVAELQASLQ